MTRNDARAGVVPESPNELDGQGRKTGQWTESDPTEG